MADPGDGPLIDEDALGGLLRDGAVLFDAGKYWEAHEVWEEAWHRAPMPERDFFQGLIHAAAACLHHSRGNAYGYKRQRERMELRLQRYGPVHREVGSSDLVEAVLGLPPPGTKGVAYPRLFPLGR